MGRVGKKGGRAEGRGKVSRLGLWGMGKGQGREKGKEGKGAG